MLSPMRFLTTQCLQAGGRLSAVSLVTQRTITSQSAAVRIDPHVLDNKDPDQVASMKQELLPIVDLEDRVIGAQSKADCHLMSNINSGLLHRAFSVLLYNSHNQFLLTQRTAAKITFPGYFTNACCSHPAATDEEMDSSNDFIGIKKAAKRRLVFELGIDPQQLQLSDIHFMTRVVYKAGSDDPIWGEHEMDYVLVIKKDLELRPNPSEVMFWKYLTQPELEVLLGKCYITPLFFTANKLLDQTERANQGEVNVSQWFYKIYQLFAKKYWGDMDQVKKLKDPHRIHLKRIPYRNTWL